MNMKNILQKFEELHQEEKQEYYKTLVAWAATNAQKSKSKSPSRRSSPSTSTKAKDVIVKKTRGKSAKTTATSDKETSSSDDESSPKMKKSIKSTASTES